MECRFLWAVWGALPEAATDRLLSHALPADHRAALCAVLCCRYADIPPPLESARKPNLATAMKGEGSLLLPAMVTAIPAFSESLLGLCSLDLVAGGDYGSTHSKPHLNCCPNAQEHDSV